MCYVLFQLLVGLGEATQTQPEAARGLISQAPLLTAAFLVDLARCLHCQDDGIQWLHRHGSRADRLLSR